MSKIPGTKSRLTGYDSMKVLRLILGDQLHEQHSWFDQVNPEITYVMMEVKQETDYVVHHIQKVVGFFAAMRAFAHRIRQQGHELHYFHLDDSSNLQSITANLSAFIENHGFQHFEYQLPDEYRLDEQLAEFCQTLQVSWHVADTEHFMTSRDELASFFRGKKTYVMESFYRHMRKKHDVLMDGGQPLTGKWNYDQDNRKALSGTVAIPKRNERSTDVTHLIGLLKKQQVTTIGSIDGQNFRWPTTRQEALADLHEFCAVFLQNFGDYQDAITERSAFCFHSLISFALNVKLIAPREVLDEVLTYREQHADQVSIASVEGFVRQVLGWREYMRGMYWHQMPQYSTMNELGHHRQLPQWYWDGQTKMNCLHHAISQSLEHAYAHHIQRLMVTGNFALLAGIDPDAVDAWYLGIYIDAIEWVEITNTRGMSQYADGGLIATKPYTSTANYLDKMGDYCQGCYYAKSKKTGDRACPFNSLYWNFHHHHRDRLEKNPRIGMVYRTWDRMQPDVKGAILAQAHDYLKRLNHL